MSQLRRYVIAFVAGLGGFIVLVGVALAQSPSPTDLMAEANAQYERGEYTGAAQQYEALIASGYAEVALYYNLGNAYFKNGDLGRAVLNYLRAEELSPRDADIRANLEFARARTVDRVESGGESLFTSVSTVARRWVTVGEMGVISLLLWVVSAIAIGALIVWRAVPRRTAVRNGAVVASAATLVSLLLLVSMLYANPNDDSGVVVESTVDVVSGPGEQYETEFTLHSGAQVRLVDSRQGWVRIALPGDDLQGWAPSNAVEAVRPGG
jgi:tetratricopeptide (TPR) repeat protein